MRWRDGTGRQKALYTALVALYAIGLAARRGRQAAADRPARRRLRHGRARDLAVAARLGGPGPARRRAPARGERPEDRRALDPRRGLAAAADGRGRVERDHGAAAGRRRREARRSPVRELRLGDVVVLGRRRARARLPVLHGRRGHVPAAPVGARELGAAGAVHGGRRLPVDDPLRCRAGAGAVRDLLPHHARPARGGADPRGPRVPGRAPAPAQEAAARPVLDLRARARRTRACRSPAGRPSSRARPATWASSTRACCWR